MHQLSSLEQQLRTMEAKIYLCSEDVRQLNSGKIIHSFHSPKPHIKTLFFFLLDSSPKELREKLVNEYMSVQRGFESMAAEWENGKIVLESFLEPPTPEDKSQFKAEEPTPPPETAEEEEDETEGKGLILDSEDVADILNLPLASKASVYEAIAGVVEKNGREKSKLSRKERIEEMRQKRAQEVKSKSNAPLIISISLNLLYI